MTEKKEPEVLFADRVLPVENLEHSILTTALEEFLDAVHSLFPPVFSASNKAIGVPVDGQIIFNTADWIYIRSAQTLPPGQFPREVPSLVIEFLSDRDNGEYDAQPGGKWWFYEKILQVPKYAIFNPKTGQLEVYKLNCGSYQPLKSRFYILHNRLSFWVQRQYLVAFFRSTRFLQRLSNKQPTRLLLD